MPQVVQGFTAHPDALPIFLLDRRFWITVFMLVVIPLSFLRKLDSLKYTSIIALSSIGYLVILVLAHFLIGDTWEARGEVRYFQWAGTVSALGAFPIVVFAYTCHQNVSSTSSCFKAGGVVVNGWSVGLTFVSDVFDSQRD